MDGAAIQTIRNYNRRWGKRAAERFASRFINLINKKYPDGYDSEAKGRVYYVIPGFEQVTRDQPIVEFNETDGIWKLSAFTLFTHIEEEKS